MNRHDRERRERQTPRPLTVRVGTQERVVPAEDQIKPRPRGTLLIIDHAELSSIVRGELDELVLDYEPPPVGQVVPVQGAVGRKASCYVRIEDSWVNWGSETGGYTVRLRLHHQEASGLFLRPRHGYTDDPAMSMAEEPEAIDLDTLEAMALENEMTSVQGAELRAAERREQWSIEDRLRRARELSRVIGVNITTELRVIEQRLDKIERKIGRRAA